MCINDKLGEALYIEEKALNINTIHGKIVKEYETKESEIKCTR